MAQFKQVNPVLPTKDVKQAIEYYTQKLGFTLAFQDDENNLKYAGVERGGIRLHLQWHDEAHFNQADFNEVEKLGLRFAIDDIDSLFKEYQDKDVFHSKTALQDTPWGTREFAFYDLDGNGLFFYCIF